MPVLYKNNIVNNAKIVIQRALKTIPSSAFSGCTSLMKLTIPESVTEIGASAFSGTNEEFTIYCKQDSEAHAAALKDEIKYVLQ